LSARPPTRLDSLTALRFVAAFGVFGLHFWLTFPGIHTSLVTHLVEQGSVGVSFFFILSGFVLTWSHRPGDTKRGFWQRRFARIYPLQFVSWAATGLILLHYSHFPTRGPALASLLLLSPWIPLHRYLDAMDASCWSLGCEAFFYFSFPFLLRAIRGRSLLLRRCLLAGCILGVVLLPVLLRGPAPGTTRFWVLYYLPPVRLAEFLVGMLIALELKQGSWPRIPVRSGLLLAGGGYVAASWAPPAYFVVAVTIIPFAVLIAAAAQRDFVERSKTLRESALVQLGAWSYAFYLFHGPVLVVAAHLVHGAPGLLMTAGVGVAALLASVAVSALCFHYIERPAERALRQPGRWRVPVTTTGVATVFSVCLATPVVYAMVDPPSYLTRPGPITVLAGGSASGVGCGSGATACTHPGVATSGGRDTSRHQRMAVRRLEGTAVSGEAAATRLAGGVRGKLQQCGSERELLPTPDTRHSPSVGAGAPTGVPHGGQGQPLPHPHQAAARAGRARGQAARCASAVTPPPTPRPSPDPTAP
jgi:peptidoglycan/LPS O-acetylase OafA/YrhL